MINFPHEPVFKNSAGVHLTNALFIELADSPEYAIYTLRRQDGYESQGRKLLSFPKLYLEIADPTEYSVAELMFDGWPHWVKVQGSYKLQSVMIALRDELEVKLRSKGIKSMISAAKSSEAAAKWLSDKGWEGKHLGRPTKERIKREADKLQRIREEVMSDAERIKDIK